MDQYASANSLDSEYLRHIMDREFPPNSPIIVSDSEDEDNTALPLNNQVIEIDSSSEDETPLFARNKPRTQIEPTQDPTQQPVNTQEREDSETVLWSNGCAICMLKISNDCAILPACGHFYRTFYNKSNNART
jgi:hypothetical protein